MMERKFTDDEIVKALDCKAEAHCAVCDTKECVPCEWCVFHYIKHALYLINRYKAENSNLTSDLTSLQNDLTSAKAEIERLEVELKAMRGAANSYKAEVERLREAYALYEETTGLKWARAEAIKEFADRIKILVDCVFLYEDNYRDPGKSVKNAIDKFVKEMTGEHNG